MVKLAILNPDDGMTSAYVGIFKSWAGGMAQAVELLPHKWEAQFKPQYH
jgi:hypothetical protein